MPATGDSPRLKALKSAPLNSWIALSVDENQVVASAGSYEELSKKIEESDLSYSVVLKTPESWAPFSV
jgi:hypothetical protein